MRERQRLFVAGPIIAAAALFSLVATRDGVADSAVLAAEVEMGTWSATGVEAGQETQRWVRDDLMRASASIPGNPATHELLGVLASRSVGEPGNEQLALDEFRNAIELRPSSPYTWLNLAELRYRTGDTGPRFGRDLRRAVELGPSEPQVQRVASFFGLAVYDELSQETRAAVEQSIQAGLRRDTLEMMQISARRGRLDVTCRLVRAMAAQVDAKSSQFCQRTGATS